MRWGGRSKPFRLKRARKVLGVPISKDTMNDINQAVKDVLTMNHVNEEEKRRRLSICDTCEHKKGSKCNLCGCFLNYKTKLTNSECPLLKWSASVSESSVDYSSEEGGSEKESH